MHDMVAGKAGSAFKTKLLSQTTGCIDHLAAGGFLFSLKTQYLVIVLIYT